ncbi:xanthine dehydrogenase family protein molybdopterin-binding subunit [Chelatococcus sp. SYSU_G07232]|uniref:Xanthine dehydrogenase family protein molybdopterin-binding subunit n=1 Tax=Chelatococcus albus TaxID=3047466 RepID=A0ABT7AIA2_9HYPH|nr:xanthine dehydrogenase family protein molybdopterin-binding subunit [Chelatococcus sp. SYSU_G07232]MDJ1158514.1 xanthine dehydrogenase family protein molybdopterin-binding subunit [Chelatococcus sp. SYSU_G07232]
MRPMKFGIGQPARRVEDVKFVTGAGRYTSDVVPEGTAHAVVVRSPHAHARFRIEDVETVRAMPGVLMVLTHADVAALGDIPCLAPAKNSDGRKMAVPPCPVLPKDTVRHVGEAVAFVVAESEAQARDAAEALSIEWDSLPVTVGIEAALAADAPLVWPQFGTNVAFDTEIGDKARTDAAFAKADRVVSLKLVNNRLVANYLETRACLAEYDAASRRWTVTLGSQGSHDIRDILATRILKVDPARVRVVTPDVGGGFGTKIFMYREYPLCAVAAERLGRPVRWVAERGEHFLGDTQGRDNLTVAEMALDKRGRFLGLRVDLKANLGAYASQFGPYVPALGAGMSPGCYDIPAVHVRVRGIYTNTVPVDAYRGAGRPEAAFVIERFVDHIARTIGKAPDALRALNFIKPSRMPHTTQTGRVYDTGEFEAHMRRAQELGDWAGFKDRLKASRRAGRLRGIGLATYIEACAGGAAEKAMVRLEKDGSVTVLIGTQSTGQGHLTAYAQLVAHHLDLPLDKVKVHQGDTDMIATGGGTGGSRSIPVGGASVAAASRTLGDNLKQLAADALEAGPADLEIAAGAVRIAGTDRALSFAEIAALPAATPELLSVEDEWTPPEATYPNGSHICEIELDPDTGAVSIERYTVVDDFGVTLNPLLLAGQVHGGAVQGIGQALHEHTVYDGDGQLVTASLMDYGLPRAGDIPSFTFETRNVPSTTNVLGMKGAGEAGAIGATPAVMNAVVDALHRAYGTAHIDMPATPARIFAAINAARAAKAA